PGWASGAPSAGGFALSWVLGGGRDSRKDMSGQRGVMFRELFLGRCSVHNEGLIRDEVHVRYGLIYWSKDYLSAWKRRFPNSECFVGGGCRLGPPRTRKVRFCPKCREEEKLWNEQNQEQREST